MFSWDTNASKGSFLKSVINESICKVLKCDLNKIWTYISYDSTDKNAGLEILKELKDHIRNPKILYGGSVNNNNAENLSKICNLDGFLIGGASLDAEQFYSIIKALKLKGD